MTMHKPVLPTPPLTHHTDGYLEALKEMRAWVEARMVNENAAPEERPCLAAVLKHIDIRTAVKAGAIWCDDTWDEPRID